MSGHGPQLRGSFWLIAAVMMNAVGGFVFWLVAARLYDRDDFGQAAALFTSVLFVNYVTSLGLPVAVARYASDASADADRLFNWALTVTFLSTTVGGLLVLVALPAEVTAPLREIGRPAGFALFTLAATGIAYTVLTEVRLMALRRWGVVLLRAGVVAVVRVPLLAWRPPGSDALWLFVLVAGTPAVTGFLLAVVLGRAGRGWSLRPLPATTKPFVRFAEVNYVGLLALQAPQFALPVIVLVNVSPTTMASFYIAFSIAGVVFLIPHTLGQVLLVEGGREARDPRAQVKLSLVLGVGLMTLATLAVVVASGAIVAVYGADFQVAADALPWFVAAAVPWAVTCSFLSSARIYEYRRAILTITGTLAVITLVPALLLTPDHGVGGAATAWIAGNVAAAVVAAVAGRSDRSSWST